MKDTTTRNWKISLLRCLAMVAILHCHFFEYVGHNMGYGEWIRIIGNYLASGVQVFLFISGYLYGKKKIYNLEDKFVFLAKNFCKILVPYYAYLVLVIYPIYTIMDPKFLEGGTWRYFQLLFCYNFPSGVHHLWYIPYILLCYLITPFLVDLREYVISISKGRKQSYYSSTFAIIIFFCLVSFVYDFYFCAIWLAMYILGYFVAGGIKQDSKGEKSRKYYFYIIIIASTMFLDLYRAYYMYIKCVDIYSLRGTFIYELYTLSFSMTAISFLLIFFVLFRNISIKENKYLRFTDKYSYGIYICHNIFISGPMSVMNAVDNILICYIIFLCLSILSGVLLTVIGRLINRVLYKYCYRLSYLEH